MSVKEIYYYLFYKFYKFAKWTPSVFSPDFGAVVLLNALELGILVSIHSYMSIILNHRSKDSIFIIELFLFGAITIFPNMIIFSKNNITWKNYIKEFDHWPKEKNIKGTYIVTVLLILTITLIAISFNLYSNLP